MNFPIWDLSFGLPLLIAFVSIPHVMVAHFAIGGGLFLAIYEGRARRTNDTALLNYTRSHSRFFMLITLVFGALTGVGIWFTISLVSPAATSALIHTFVWFWATEWVMFFVEIAASLVYYYGWDRLDGRTHERVMWIYFIAAWGSLAVINGIITFMLTSGTWVADRNIWPAFFNPTYWPSLIFRTLICFLMAGIFAILTAAWHKDELLGRRINRIALIWSLPTIIAMIPVGYWYHASLPEATLASIAGGWRAIANAQDTLIATAIGLAVVVVLIAMIRNKLVIRILAIILVALGLKAFGSFEWYREAARKPFVISGYMYSNGIVVSDTTAIRTAGLYSSIKWKHDDVSRRGEDLFRAACQSCHSLSGYNGVARMVAERGWSEPELANLIPRTGYMRGAMPPFLGNAAEAADIAGYIFKSTSGLDIPAVAKTPQRIWDNNCGLCHSIDESRPLRAALSGMSLTDLKEAILTADQLSDVMPPFMGTDADAAALATHLEKVLQNPTVAGAK